MHSNYHLLDEWQLTSHSLSETFKRNMENIMKTTQDSSVIIDGIVCDAELDGQLKMKIHGQESIHYINSIIEKGRTVPLFIDGKFIGPIKFISQYSLEWNRGCLKSIGIEFLINT